MALPVSRPRTYSLGDPVEPDDLNSIFDEIVRLMGDGELDVELQANEGIVIPSTKPLELGGSLRAQLYHTGWDRVMQPYSECIWAPSDDGDILIDPTDGFISAVSGSLRLHVPLRVPAAVTLQQILVRHRQHASATVTAVLRQKTAAGVVTDLTTEVSSAGSALAYLTLETGGPWLLLEDVQYYLTIVLSGSGVEYHHTRPYWNKPPP